MATYKKPPLKYRIAFKLARLFGYKMTINQGGPDYPSTTITLTK